MQTLQSAFLQEAVHYTQIRNSFQCEKNMQWDWLYNRQFMRLYWYPWCASSYFTVQNDFQMLRMIQTVHDGAVPMHICIIFCSNSTPTHKVTEVGLRSSLAPCRRSNLEIRIQGLKSALVVLCEICFASYTKEIWNVTRSILAFRFRVV